MAEGILHIECFTISLAFGLVETVAVKGKTLQPSLLDIGAIVNAEIIACILTDYHRQSTLLEIKVEGIALLHKPLIAVGQGGECHPRRIDPGREQNDILT